MDKYAVILAGGSGLRAGREIPKQFCKLLGIPMLWWSVRAFIREDRNTRIILAMHPEWKSVWEGICGDMPEPDRNLARGITIVDGGPTRGESVANALKAIPDEESLTAVHDAARPLVTPGLIGRGWKTAALHGSGVPVVEVTDSLRLRDSDSGASKAVDRTLYAAVQTPQVFRTDILKGAYRSRDVLCTDDASLVEKNGHSVSLFHGDTINFKVTNPEDFARAEGVLKQRLLSKEGNEVGLPDKIDSQGN